MPNYNLYTMYDRKSGIYGSPFVSHNDKTATRDFDSFCALPQNKYLSADMELYKLGTFNSSTGEIEHFKPEFIKAGELYE